MHKFLSILLGLSLDVFSLIPLTNNELPLTMLNGCPGDDCVLLRNIKQHPFFISNAYGPDNGTNNGTGVLRLQIFHPSHWPFRLHSDENEICSSNSEIGSEEGEGQTTAPTDGTGYCLGLSSLTIDFTSKVDNDQSVARFGGISGSSVGTAATIVPNPADWLPSEEWAAEINAFISGSVTSYLKDIELTLNHDLSWVEKDAEDTFHLSFRNRVGSVDGVRLTKNVFTKSHNGKHKKRERHLNPFDPNPVGNFKDEHINDSLDEKFYVSGHSVKELIFSYGLVVLAYAHSDSPLYDEKLASLAIKEFDIICRANEGNPSPNLVLGNELWPTIAELYVTSTNELFKIPDNFWEKVVEEDSIV